MSSVNVPKKPKIYHIVHVDRLASIIKSRGLLCDAQVTKQNVLGTTIGMSRIKQRRLNKLKLSRYPNLYVGQFVPFYFCPRSVMLFLIYIRNDELTYKGGQDPIIHLQADLYKSVRWAQEVKRHWAFTLSNAGSYYFEDRNNLACLNDLDWQAIGATKWCGKKDGKQAEFLMGHDFPWHLIEIIGVKSRDIYQQVASELQTATQGPSILIKPDWYY